MITQIFGRFSLSNETPALEQFLSVFRARQQVFPGVCLLRCFPLPCFEKADAAILRDVHVRQILCALFCLQDVWLGSSRKKLDIALLLSEI